MCTRKQMMNKIIGMADRRKYTAFLAVMRHCFVRTAVTTPTKTVTSNKTAETKKKHSFLHNSRSICNTICAPTNTVHRNFCHRSARHNQAQIDMRATETYPKTDIFCTNTVVKNPMPFSSLTVTYVAFVYTIAYPLYIVNRSKNDLPTGFPSGGH